MLNNLKYDLWLVGSGLMSIEYSKVLNGLKVNYIVIGRGEKSANFFKEKTNKGVATGGLSIFITKQTYIPKYAIVSVNVESLYETTIQLLNYGVKNILVEKPGALFKEQLLELEKLAINYNSNLFIGYNRRFLSSVIMMRKLIKSRNEIKSLHFEFTEWSHLIEKLDKSDLVLNNWFIANSTHVIDLAFFLAGNPIKIASFVSGTTSWYKRGSIFVGSGITERDALFSYGSNWKSPGRWSLYFCTDKNRYLFSPMEKLQIQNIGSVKREFVEIDYEELILDELYKPGLYIQVQKFISGDYKDLCTIKEQVEIMGVYEIMQNGGVLD